MNHSVVVLLMIFSYDESHMDSMLAIDRSLLLAANGLTGRSIILDGIFKFVALWLVYLIPILLIIVWFSGQKEKLVAIRVVLFGLFGWFVVNALIGTFWFRNRPFLRLLDAQELIFHQPDKSFPSDHATLGFAVAIGFLLAGYKKLGWFLIVWTIIFSIARVIVAVHFPLDILGGFVVGFMVAWAGHFLQELFDKYVGAPLIRLAKIVRLA